MPIHPIYFTVYKDLNNEEIQGILLCIYISYFADSNDNSRMWQQNGPSTEGDNFIGGNFSTDGVIQEDVIVASHMNDFLFNKELINSYFDQCLDEMSMFDLGSSARLSNFNSEGKKEILMTSTLLYKELSQSTTRGMPSGYSGPLPSGGSSNGVAPV